MLNGNQPNPESNSAPSAAPGERTSATAASQSHDATEGSFGSATTADSQVLHPKHLQWLEARGIDAELAAAFGLATASIHGANWIAVPYRHKGETVNHKYRLTSEKRHQMDVGARLTLWNADCLRDDQVRKGQQHVIVTEGEWDALTAIKSGFPFTVSVPNGAPSSETEDLDNAKRYDWVDVHAEDLARVAEFIIATDDDAAGHYLRADLVSLLGADRCRFVEYPFPCKDLNEVLVEYGNEAVTKCLSTAKPFPVQGLYRPSDFPERGEVRSYAIGVSPISEMIYVVPGTLTVVTGFANMGKSTLMNAVIGHTLRWNFPVCIASFETDVKPILIDGLRMTIMQCDKHDLSKVDTSDADELIESRLTIISQSVDEDLEMDLVKFLDLCRTAVIRNGVKMIVLDPWNELEHKRRKDESETDYISRALRAIKRFAKQYDVAFWIVAHPTKPQEGSRKVPGLYDISGSANWANKADYGLTYHRPIPDQNMANILISKIRMGLPGRKGMASVKYDFRKSEFVDASASD